MKTASSAKHKVREVLNELREKHPLIDFGVTKLIQIKDDGKEVEIPI